MRQGGWEQSVKGGILMTGIHFAPPKIDFSFFKVPILVATQWMPVLHHMWRWSIKDTTVIISVLRLK